MKAWGWTVYLITVILIILLLLIIPAGRAFVQDNGAIVATLIMVMFLLPMLSIARKKPGMSCMENKGRIMAKTVIACVLFAICFGFAAEKFPALADYRGHAGLLMFAIMMVGGFYEYYKNILSKPRLSVRAKVKGKEYIPRNQYAITFLLADRSTLELDASKRQYESVKRGVIVDLVYQGRLARSIKRDVDEKPIKH